MDWIKNITYLINNYMSEYIIFTSYFMMFLSACLICPIGFRVVRYGDDPLLLFIPGITAWIGIGLFFWGIIHKIGSIEQVEYKTQEEARLQYKMELMGISKSQNKV